MKKTNLINQIAEIANLKKQVKIFNTNIQALNIDIKETIAKLEKKLVECYSLNKCELMFKGFDSRENACYIKLVRPEFSIRLVIYFTNPDNRYKILQIDRTDMRFSICESEIREVEVTIHSIINEISDVYAIPEHITTNTTKVGDNRAHVKKGKTTVIKKRTFNDLTTTELQELQTKIRDFMRNYTQAEFTRPSKIALISEEFNVAMEVAAKLLS